MSTCRECPTVSRNSVWNSQCLSENLYFLPRTLYNRRRRRLITFNVITD